MIAGAEDMTVLDAFAEALASTSRRPAARKYWENDQKKFTDWLTEKHPKIEFWAQITRRMLREFIAAKLATRGPNGVRLAMQPICQTAFYMSREYQVPNVAERLGLSTKLVRDTPMVALVDVLAFLDCLKVSCPRLEVGAALQGLAGLQLQEALRLTWSNVDLENGLIAITGEVKNEYRERVIPVCSRVLDALKRAATRPGGRVGCVVKTSTGLPFTQTGQAEKRESGWRQYSKEMRLQLRAWNPDIKWAPKDLRNCLPTYATLAGIKNDIWEQYIGHAPASITARHYVPRLVAKSDGEKELLRRSMEILRRRVVAEIEAACAPQLDPETSTPQAVVIEVSA